MALCSKIQVKLPEKGIIIKKAKNIHMYTTSMLIFEMKKAFQLIKSVLLANSMPGQVS